MMLFHPIPQIACECPVCSINLNVVGWYIPGMRNLAKLECKQCRNEYFYDLPSGHGLYYPMLLDANTGNTVKNAPKTTHWFAQWLESSYQNKYTEAVSITKECLRPLQQPVLLNCLDRLYGHCLLKLLNVQHYIDHHPELDILLIIPKFLRWLVPEGVAEVWCVDIPLRQGHFWNDTFAGELKSRLESFDECKLLPAFPDPDAAHFDIDRFSRITPFPTKEWVARLHNPTITFIWREDRLWERDKPALIRKVYRKLHISTQSIDLVRQRSKIVRLATLIKEHLPALDFGVAGLGKPGGFPHWIQDMRSTKVSNDLESEWCQRYAASHIVIGVHGSNLLLPSAHAGSVIDLMPNERWGNHAQDIIQTSAQTGREVMIRHRFLSLDSSPGAVAKTAVDMLYQIPNLLLRYQSFWNNPQKIESDPYHVQHLRQGIAEALNQLDKQKLQ